MTDEAIRIAIAEACEFVRNDERDCWQKDGRSYFNAHPQHFAQIPDYLSDLNACHEMEKVLTPQQEDIYNKELFVITAGLDGWNWHATARQRCEAFLRTLRKWEE